MEFIGPRKYRELQRYSDLVLLLTKKEVTLKYKRTYLGVLWSLFNPLLTGIVYYIAFKIFMRIPVENYTLFLLSVIFPWTWFSATITMSAGTLIANVQLIKKVRFPRHFLLGSLTVAQLVNFLFSIPVILAFVYVHGNYPSVIWIIGIPLLIAIQFLLTLGVSLVVSAINAYFRDMEYLVTVLINVLFWLTPIVYPISTIPYKYRIYFNFNPLSSLMLSWRELFMNNTLDWPDIGLSTLIAIVVLFCGIVVFHALGRRLDDVL
jgi:lipopolysaccharide transport system permease protein